MNDSSSIVRLAELSRNIRPISGDAIGVTATTANTLMMEQYFVRLLRSSDSILVLLEHIDETHRYPDLASVSGIARDMMDAYDIMFYLFFEPVSRERRRFRHCLYHYHHSCENESISSYLHQGNLLAVPMTRITAADLQAEPEFQKLTRRQQQALLKGRTATFDLTPRSSFPFEEDAVRTVYKLLSNLVHSTSLGQTLGVPFGGHGYPHALALLRIATDVATYFLAQSARDYLRKRYRLRFHLTRRASALLAELPSDGFGRSVRQHWNGVEDAWRLA